MVATSKHFGHQDTGFVILIEGERFSLATMHKERSQAILQWICLLGYMPGTPVPGKTEEELQADTWKWMSEYYKAECVEVEVRVIS